MRSKEILEEISHNAFLHHKFINFESFYKKIIKEDPLFFKDYYITYCSDFYFRKSLNLENLKGLDGTTFSCANIITFDSKTRKKYFEKLNFFLACESGEYSWFLSIETIRDILNNSNSVCRFSGIDDSGQLIFESRKNKLISLHFPPEKFENFLTDEEKKKLKKKIAEIKASEIEKEIECMEQYKRGYEKSKRKLEEMKSKLTEEERVLLMLRGII